MEGGLLRPAVGFEGLANVAFHIGCHGTGAIMVLVIALAGIDMDEVVLNGTLHTAWHIIIDSGDTNRHANGLVLAEQRTILTLHLRVVQVDTVGIYPVFRFVTGKYTMETMLTKGADRAIADTVVISLLCKNLLSGLWGLFFFLHIGSKINTFVGV